MRVVMADVEKGALDAAVDGLEHGSADVLAVVTDVSDPDQVDALRDSALATFGGVHLLCNNAGVGGPHSPIWETTRGDIEWVLGVNTWGVINGIRSFVPKMLRQDIGHVINTSSIFGLFAGRWASTGLPSTPWWRSRRRCICNSARPAPRSGCLCSVPAPSTPTSPRQPGTGPRAPARRRTKERPDRRRWTT